MATTRSRISGDLAVAILKELPKASSKRLARILVERRPEVFHDIEYARKIIRNHRGTGGHRTRTPPVTEALRDPAVAEACRKSGYGLPVPEPSEFRIYDMKALFPEVEHWLDLPDLHGQFYDQPALETTLNWALSRPYRFDGLLFHGDLVDCYAIAPFHKDPRKMEMDEEADFVGQLLRAIINAVKPRRTIWKKGNHEWRWNVEAMVKAPQLYKAKGILELEDLEDINFKQIGDLVVPDNCLLSCDELFIAHGHELGRGTASPVNAARNAILKAMQCVCIAHTHRRSSHDEVTVRDRLLSGESLGCLCDLHPRWSPINKWQHGFAVLHVDPDWHLENKKIVHGKVF